MQGHVGINRAILECVGVYLRMCGYIYIYIYIYRNMKGMYRFSILIPEHVGCIAACRGPEP